MRRGAAVASLLLATTALTSCTFSDLTEATSTAIADQDAVDESQVAIRLAQATSVHPATMGTLLEGPTFGADGLLYFVDVMAPPGAPKVLRMDVAAPHEAAEPVYTDDTASALTSAQFHPMNGRLYVTDFLSGSIISMTPDGADPQVAFEGDVGGVAMQPDDIAFDPEGNMFVSDTRGTDGPGWVTPGRVVRVGTDGAPSVLADNLPSPNGISFDEDFAGLWVAQYNANRLDYYTLDPDRERVLAAYPAVYVQGGRGRVDSTAVDADGNVYQAFHNKPEIQVFSSDGQLVQTITAPEEGLTSATNVAIQPGTTRGFITVSGESGGFIYTFDALGEGIKQSNGG